MKKCLIFLLVIVCLSQVGFAKSIDPLNNPLGDNQEVFYRFSVEESERIRFINGIEYYPTEEAVYLRLNRNWPRGCRNDIVVTESGFMEEEPSFYAESHVFDFKTDGDSGYLLGEAQGLFHLMNEESYVIFPSLDPGFSIRFANFSVKGSRMLVLEFSDAYGEIDGQILTLPDNFAGQALIPDQPFLLDDIVPFAFDLSADGETAILFGPDFKQKQVDIREDMTDGAPLYLEFLPVDGSPEIQAQVEVLIEGYQGEQACVVRDIYTTEDHIIVLFHELNQERAFVQRYTYEGEFLDQVETNYRTRCITPGPDGSTLYLHKRFLNEEELEQQGFSWPDWQLEIIQVNWGTKTKEADLAGRMRPVVAERTFGGKTIARFNDQGFGLIKELEKETGIMDYRAPLKSVSNDVRLQIPYCDLLAKAGAARDLLIQYQGHEIRITMDTFAGDLLTDMPCDTEATIEIHLTIDESDNVDYMIDFFVVEQVDAMTRVVHRKPMQEIKN